MSTMPFTWTTSNSRKFSSLNSLIWSFNFLHQLLSKLQNSKVWSYIVADEKIYTQPFHVQSTYFGSNSTLQPPCNMANMQLTSSWYCPSILGAASDYPKDSQTSCSRPEYLTIHRDHWPKADQENPEGSAGQGNCRAMLNTTSDLDFTAWHLPHLHGPLLTHIPLTLP